MAQDPNPVTVKITSVADTTGVEEVQDGLKAVETSTQDTGSAADDANEKLQTLVGLERAQMAVQLAQGINQIAESARRTAQEFKETDKEMSKTFENVATGLDSLSAGLSLAAQGFSVGGPFGAAIGGLVGLMTGPLKSAFSDMLESLANVKRAEKESEDATKQLGETRRKLAQQLREEGIEQIYRGELKALGEVEAQLERNSRIAAAQRSANNAVQSANNSVSNIGRAETPAGEINQATQEATQKLADIDAKVLDAQNKAAASADAASQTAASAAAQAAELGDGHELSIESAKVAKTAQDAAEKAAANADEVVQIANAERTKVAAGFLQALSGIGDEVSAKATETAKSTIEAINKTAAENGGQINGMTKLAFENLTKIVGDAIPDSQQMAEIAQAMKLAKDSGDIHNRETLQNLQQMSRNFDSLLAVNRELKQKIDNQTQAIKSISGN